MKINIYNHKKKLKLTSSLIKKLIKELLIHEKARCDEVSLHFVNEKTIKRLHKKYFNDSSPTDTIAFPIDPPGDVTTGYCFLGDIFVSVDAAINYARDYKLDPFDETMLYIVHGLLHLLGYDDISKKDKTIMHKKEKSCMNFIKKKKLFICSRESKQLMQGK